MEGRGTQTYLYNIKGRSLLLSVSARPLALGSSIPVTSQPLCGGMGWYQPRLVAYLDMALTPLHSMHGIGDHVTFSTARPVA